MTNQATPSGATSKSVADANVTPIVVTGANGFVGRAVVDMLLAQGRHVVASDINLEHTPSSSALRAVAGNLGAPDVRNEVFREGCAAIIHLAAVPGGAAENDPLLSRRVNIESTLDLINAAHAAGTGTPVRFVYASSIAVFGDKLPPNGLDDTTEVAPWLVYGAHKAMMEIAIATASRRGDIDGISLRLPGVLARPRAPSGLKSAFMSDLFHALRAGDSFACPVSEDATIWAESITQCATNLIHALSVDTTRLPTSRALTLPALRIRMRDLVAAVAHRTRRDPALIDYRCDPEVEANFGRQPELATPAADALGFRHDGTVEGLVDRALARIEAVER